MRLSGNNTESLNMDHRTSVTCLESASLLARLRSYLWISKTSMPISDVTKDRIFGSYVIPHFTYKMSIPHFYIVFCLYIIELVLV